MHPFTYLRVADEGSASTAGANAKAAFLAGGTTLVDLMRLEVMRPEQLVDINGLTLTEVEDIADGGLRIGAMVTNSKLAAHGLVGKNFPVLTQAILSGASPQIRNVATTGGNLLQRTRCPYFRDPHTSACNKRVPGSGCAAIGGVNRSHAVLGVSEKCIATHPSDMAVALVALDAVVHVVGASGKRMIPLTQLHEKPGDNPEVETSLKPGELITHVEIPGSEMAKRSRYVKVRDRASFAFALASAAVSLDIAGGTIKVARIAFGGIGTVPWRSKEAEEALVGKPATRPTFEAAAQAALVSAKAQPGNEFKIDLARRTLVRALEEVSV